MWTDTLFNDLLEVLKDYRFSAALKLATIPLLSEIFNTEKNISDKLHNFRRLTQILLDEISNEFRKIIHKTITENIKEDGKHKEDMVKIIVESLINIHGGEGDCFKLFIEKILPIHENDPDTGRYAYANDSEYAE